MIASFSRLLPLISGAIVTGCLVYCRFWWTPHPMTITDPDESIVCWFFCKTMSDFWFILGVFFSSVSILGGVMMGYHVKWAKSVALFGGILIAPAGLINIISYYYVKDDMT